MPRLLLAWLGIAVALLDRLLKVALECQDFSANSQRVVSLLTEMILLSHLRTLDALQ